MSLALCFCGGSGALADPPAGTETEAPANPSSDAPASVPKGSFFSSLKQAIKQDLDREVVRGHFDVGTPPDAHRYYCLVDPKSGKGEANGVGGQPVLRPDGMTGIKAGGVSFYGCANAERQGILVTTGYVLSAGASAKVASASSAQKQAGAPAPNGVSPGKAESRDRALASPPTRQQLIGAWRLMAIEYTGPRGETVDPFYQADSSGIIIYDSSGWMSVQISAPNRRAWEVPATRVPLAAEEETRLKSEAFDTYYSYYGTWDYDPATSVVTHHVKSSVIPAETGLSYGQTVTFEGGHLIFTVRSGNPATETVRKKVWQRL